MVNGELGRTSYEGEVDVVGTFFEVEALDPLAAESGDLEGWCDEGFVGGWADASLEVSDRFRVEDDWCQEFEDSHESVEALVVVRWGDDLVVGGAEVEHGLVPGLDDQFVVEGVDVVVLPGLRVGTGQG